MAPIRHSVWCLCDAENAGREMVGPLGIGLFLGMQNGAPVPVIALSDAAIPDDAGIGDLVGTLSVVGGTGTYAFTLTDDADGLFALNGVDDTRLEVAAALTAGTQSIIVRADNGSGSVATRTIEITVTSTATFDSTGDTFDASTITWDAA